MPGQRLIDPGHEVRPLAFVVEVVHHERTAPLEILPQPPRLRLGERPVAHAHGIDPRPIENLVAIDVDDLLDASRVNPREAPQALHKLPFGLIRVGAPTRPAPTPVAE